MTELSPDTQQVLDAFRSSHTGQGCLAAALRAVVDHCKIELTFYPYDPEPELVIFASDLLAIADELEAQ